MTADHLEAAQGEARPEFVEPVRDVLVGGLFLFLFPSLPVRPGVLGVIGGVRELSGPGSRPVPDSRQST